MLKLNNIEAGYGNMQILFGISLELKEKETVALIGPNGCGKTTTLKSILKLIPLISGDILFFDQSLNNKKTHEIVKLGISYVPQGRLVFPSLTIEENLKMGAYTLKKEEAQKRLQEMYKRFQILKEKRKQKATFLSGGQQQLLSIARALILKPKLLLLDEPSLGLSPIAIKEVFQEIKKLNQEGISILIVEQNVHLALEICNKVYVLHSGKVTHSGGKELIEKGEIKDLYLGH